MLYDKARHNEDMYIIHTYTKETRDKSKPLHMYDIQYPDLLCSLVTENKDDILDFITETFQRFGAFNYHVSHKIFENGRIIEVN